MTAVEIEGVLQRWRGQDRLGFTPVFFLFSDKRTKKEWMVGEGREWSNWSVEQMLDFADS